MQFDIEKCYPSHVNRIMRATEFIYSPQFG